MTIQYKNAIKSLADTNLNTVLTISTTAVAIIKSVYFIKMMPVYSKPNICSIANKSFISI